MQAGPPSHAWIPCPLRRSEIDREDVGNEFTKKCNSIEVSTHYLCICEVDLVWLEKRLYCLNRIAFASSCKDYLVLLAVIVLEQQPRMEISYREQAMFISFAVRGSPCARAIASHVVIC